MKTATELLSDYHRLDAKSSRIIQVFALSFSCIRSYDFIQLIKKLTQEEFKQKPFKDSEVRTKIKKLVKQELLMDLRYQEFVVHPAIQDYAVQDLILNRQYDLLAKQVKEWIEDKFYYRNDPERELRFAFYDGDSESFQKNLHGKISFEDLNLLNPFSADVYNQLDPILQKMYLADIVPRVITGPGDCDVLLETFDEEFKKAKTPSNEMIAAQLDLSIARGDIKALKALDKQTKQKHPEIAGSIAMLQGKYDEAQLLFSKIISSTKRKIKLDAIRHLPALFYLMLLLKDGTRQSLKEVDAICKKVIKGGQGAFKDVMYLFEIAVSFKKRIFPLPNFIAGLNEHCTSPLNTLIIGYFGEWFISDEDESTYQLSNLVQLGEIFHDTGMNWFGAEVNGLAGRTKLKVSKGQQKKHEETHAKQKTKSLLGLIEPESEWQRSLTAIAQLSGTATSITEDNIPLERLIWELNTKVHSIYLDGFIQKRKGKGWTKGRKVSLKRLHMEHNDNGFHFLSDQDRKLCQAIEMYTDRGGYYGDSETYYQFHDLRTARALIGHPAVFRPGDRDNPLEITEQLPKLVVAHDKKKNITITLEPKPENSDDEILLVPDGSTRLAIVFFNEEHRRLNHVLGDQLKVPQSAAEKVVETIQSVSSLVAVHSEIGGETTTGETVKADSQLHVHLLPYQSGVRVEHFVRPFGDAGPFCRPGQGGANVFANIEGVAKSATRNLKAEKKAEETLFNACPEIASRIDGNDSVCLPTPEEALEVLVELENLVTKKRLILHWPQGKSLSLVGQATASQMQVSIRKSRDWFAASGTLKVNKGLSLDMMKVIKLVEESSSRFVQLDDGSFLALTEKLRKSIEDISAYSHQGSEKKNLQFPKVRAAAIEDLGESFKLKTDKHWKEWVARMHQATDIQPKVPSTFQAELRDYQLEGFNWLARLAAWGVGGCLADDMGLGKTIQALALLLHRASEGPALVVAPTSVAFNWMSEIQKFAPTLKPHLFGEGNRGELLKNLGPMDVVICTYGLLHNEAELLHTQTWNSVILDEAQAIKNTATRRSKAAMGLQADFRLIMTGTPLENHLGELWNLMEFINPGLLGTLKKFQSQFAGPIERDGCRKTRGQLKKLIQPFILRRTKSQVLEELPPRTEVTLQVELGEEEAAFYEALRQRTIEKLEDVDETGPQHLKILAEIMKLRRACCHPKLALEGCKIPGAKLALFSKTVDDLLDNNHKVLVFSQFVDHLAILREELDSKEVSYQYLDGSTPAKKRKTSVEAFQAGDGDVFLISLKAGGLGLNLTAADYVIHMDPWWNPAVEDQASDRAHRMGQKRPVTIYRFITQGTIEQSITDLHATKRDLADSLMEGTEMSGKLSAKELLKLITDES